MSRELKEAKFHGFQLGIQIAIYLSEQGCSVTFMEALGAMRNIADGNHTISDPENAGRGFDAVTVGVVRDIGMTSVALQQGHARDMQSGLASISADALEN